MAIGFPKPRPRLLEKRKSMADVAKIDREERAKVRARSGGRCEVQEGAVPFTWIRCRLRAVENHHLISGIGRRNRGRSILAEHRLDVCKRCHQEITNHVLVPAGWPNDAERAETVKYERKWL